MPAKSKESRLPKFIEPKNWRKQVEAAIKDRLHPGRGGDDTGGLAPLALKMLARPEMDTIIKWLIVENGEKQFTRFDTYEDGGLDLVDIIEVCVFLGKEVRPPEYDLKLIANELKTADPDRMELLRSGIILISDQMSLEKETGRGRPQDVQMNSLIMRLDHRFRNRFCKPDGKGKAFHVEIAMLLQITPWMSGADDKYIALEDRKMTPGAVEQRLKENRLIKTKLKKLMNILRERREWKLKIRTGAKDSYRTIKL
jgi:hypothetical protein